jgi:hypothetical protein
MPKIGGGNISAPGTGGTTTAGGKAPAAAALAGVIATMRRGYRSACIQLIGDSTGDGYAPVTGTNVDEWPQVFARRLARDYPAYTLLHRRWNDTAQGYDPATVLQTGTGNGGGDRYATFAKATPGSLTYTGAAITGDIDVRVRVAPTTWTATGDQTLAAKWESTTNNRSWLFSLKTTGALGFNWSTNGTAGIGEKVSTAVLGATVTNNQPYWVRATLDVDNGATGNDVRFYSSPDGTTWTQLGTTVTTAGVTSMFGGTGPYQIGSFTVGFSTPLDGRVYSVFVGAGLTSTQSVVAPLPDDWELLSAETTVTFGGAPVLTLLNGSQSGQNVAYFDNAARRTIINQPHGQSVIFLSTGHNDVTQNRQTWLTNYAAWVGNIKSLVPGVPIVAFGQNPTGVGGAFNITAPGVELRASRGAILQQWAASQAGVYGFDAWPLLTAADTVDQLHPTAGAGSGSEKWGLGLYAAVV